MTEVRVTRNVCPRNCYDTCAMLSHVKGGKLVKVEGDPLQGYNQGRLCAKGYAYTHYVYHPQRLRYPLRQYPRGSGNWVRITWDEAIRDIAAKILELNQRYGSNLPLAYNKCSGNIGILHSATEGMFNSFGSHTKLKGNPCNAAGQDAVFYGTGEVNSPDPEEMAGSKLIVIWGANSAWTAVHQLGFINQARDKGARLVVIDPVYTATAAAADYYIQLYPGSDGLLALGVAKILAEEGRYDLGFIADYTAGWDSFLSYLKEKVNLEEVERQTGVPADVIKRLADLYWQNKPVSSWCGYGLQRYENGGQNVRAIHSLSALTGNIGKAGGGFYYFHPGSNAFPNNLLNHQGPADEFSSRTIDINNYPSQALSLTDPPVKFLWIAGRNPLSQDQEVKNWQKLLAELELVVTVDLFMTKTAEASDIVLPAASHFEDLDLNVSYWHHWLALNEKSLESFYEAKSDLEIARILTRRLHELKPGFSNFPFQRTPEEWLEREFSAEVLDAYGLSDWQDLIKAPAKLKKGNRPWKNYQFKTETGKFEFFSKDAKEDNLPALPRYWNGNENSEFPLRLITPQNMSGIHSQSWAQELVSPEKDENTVRLSPMDAEARNVGDGDYVKIHNRLGSVTRRAKICEEVLEGVVIIYQSGKEPINTLLSGLASDMGRMHSGSEGAALYNAFVDVEKVVKDWHE